jgi:hypothetical protein
MLLFGDGLVTGHGSSIARSLVRQRWRVLLELSCALFLQFAQLAPALILLGFCRVGIFMPYFLFQWNPDARRTAARGQGRRAAKSRARPAGGITSELAVSQRNRKT